MAWRSRCSRISTSVVVRIGLGVGELDLAAAGRDDAGQVDDAGDRPRLPAMAARRTAEAVTVSSPAIANRALTPERWSTWLDSRTSQVKRAMISARCSGTIGASNVPCPRPTHARRPAPPGAAADLVGELQRVVGAHLGAEAVLERGDDPPAVGVVLGVGAGDEQQVQRQPHA